MAIREIITANCENGQLSKSKIARQWDDQGTLIQFAGYPEPETDEELIFRLIVWMRASEDAEPVELPPIELEADQWLISNYYTQLPQMLRFQLCITNEAGTYEKHSPIFSGIVDKSLSHNGEGADIDVIPLFDPYKKYVDELVVDAGARVVDTELDETSANLVENKAVATAVTALNGRLGEQSERITIMSSGKQTISGDLSYGVFENNFPYADPRKFNAVMMTAEKYDRDITITAKDGYNFLAYWYDENDNYVGRTAQWVTSRAIPANTPFRLWVRESPLDTSVVLDLTVVKNHIVFNTPQQDEIDKNISDVALNTTNVNLNGQGLQQIDTDFVWGTMNTSTGEVVVYSGYKYQVVMPSAVHYDRDVTIKCNAGYRYQVWWYSASDEYISRTGGFKTSSDEYVVTAGTYFRLFVTLDPPNNKAVVDPSVFTANVLLVTVLGEKVDAIVNQPLSTLPEYVLNSLSYKPVGPLSKGYILMSCDDGTAGLATYTIPMLISKGVPATFGLLDTSPVITNDTYLATVIDAVENHGCCVAQHGSAQWPTYSEKALTAYFDSTENLFNSKGITEIHGAICPGGASADTNTLVKAIAGGRFGSVFSGGLQDELKYGNYNEVGPRTNQYAMARYSAIGFTESTYKAAIDEAYNNHLILCPFWHDYSIVNDTAKQAIIEGMIDYAKDKGLTFITMKDLPNVI